MARLVLLQEEKEGPDLFFLSTMCGHSKKVDDCKPDREPPPGIASSVTLILNYSASITMRNEFLLLNQLTITEGIKLNLCF